MMDSSGHACGVERSIGGKRWIWRGGNMDLTSSPGGSDNLAHQLLLARGVPPHDIARQRQPTLREFLPDPSCFRDMDVAAERIARAVSQREKVVVFGDYDVDGATSAALMVRLFAMLGHRAEFYIPDRLLEGYGPSGAALVRLREAGADLIITVDCGAMAHEALEMAHAAGVDVLVVDHHKCAPELPRAVAVVNPNRLDESDQAAAHGHLAAVGVAFLLAVSTIRVLREQGRFRNGAEPDLMSLLDLVALGTVADVASLQGLNRAFVAQGLKVMARRRNIGLAALIDAARLTRAPTCSDLGFALGPRINAGGRVGEATLGVRLLLTEEMGEAQELAERLCRHNEERRVIERCVQDEAEAQLASQSAEAVQIVSGRDWHPGVIGIVASRIKEKTGKPAVVIAIDPATGIGKGSARSITGVDIGAAIIAARDHGLLMAGGGHAMAGGLTVAGDRFEALAGFLRERLAVKVAGATTARTVALDIAVAPGGLTPDLVEQLDSAGPYGTGWPTPRVASGPVQVVKAGIVGQDHVRLVVRGQDGGTFKAVGFRIADSELGQTLLHGVSGRRLWLAGRARRDDWSSRPAAELHLEDAAFADR